MRSRTVLRIRSSIAVVATISCLTWTAAAASAQSPAIVEFFAGGKLQRGLPLVDYAHELVVIGRDGWMHSLDPRNPETQVRHVKGTYSPLGIPELRNQLRNEFGPKFEVTTTPSFLVVQPKGRGNRWPKMFEQSHRGFINYMRRHGVNIRQGRFPMVAIVFPDQQAMYAAFRKEGIDVSRVSGLYSGNSNRVMTHDGGRIESIAATVRHETAHQSAFNSGVHSRVNDTPRWITEGIGQMFEPAAMTSTIRGANLADRLNRDSMSMIQAKYPGRDNERFHQTVMQLIGDDSLFDREQRVDEAYAVSWAMMFYLAERRPKAFASLLNHTATRPPFEKYERSQRVADVEQIVGTGIFEFSRNVRYFLDQSR